MEEHNYHVPVMLKEVLEFSNLKKDSIVVDMTLGRGGHSHEMLKLIPDGFLYGVDQDQTALAYSYLKLHEVGKNFKTVESRFSKAPDLLKEQGVESADFILYDLGVSSPQFDDPQRGFSYRFDAKLDMRMDQVDNDLPTAYDIVNKAEPRTLIKALYEYADEKFAKVIVHNIVKHRKLRPIVTTFELVDIIKETLPEKELRKPGHPAKKTFLALRYLVNSEKEEIIEGLPKGIEFLRVGGRMMVITFNSYEDGLVKGIFKNYTTKTFTSKYLPPEESNINYRLVTNKPLAPSEEEIKMNNRSKPAKLRIIERIR